MQNKFFYIANWKSYLSYQQAVYWCAHHAAELKEIADQGNVVICSDFLAISDIQKILPSTMALGAQNCSMHTLGAFTGEVSAQSLQEVGVRYCIIGHSERRKMFDETSEIIGQKMERLLEQGIVPIICVSDEYAIELKPIANLFKSKTYVLIAYEPIAAIGTGNVASNQHIEKVFQSIKKICRQKGAELDIRLLYGGSVNGQNSAVLKKIELLDGFLIGKASMDFIEFKQIILA